jgi:hypothetical protein
MKVFWLLEKLLQVRGPKLVPFIYAEQRLNSRNILEINIMGIQVWLKEGNEKGIRANSNFYNECLFGVVLQLENTGEKHTP